MGSECPTQSRHAAASSLIDTDKTSPLAGFVEVVSFGEGVVSESLAGLLADSTNTNTGSVSRRSCPMRMVPNVPTRPRPERSMSAWHRPPT